MIKNYVALDLETTGLNPKEDRIIEIGMIKVVDGNVCGEYSKLINPFIPINDKVAELTGITDDMVRDCAGIDARIEEIAEFMGELPILGHNIIFDYSFLKKACVNHKLTFEKCGIDTLKIARKVLPELPNRSLSYLCEHFGIDEGGSHRALYDARKAMEIYNILYEKNPDEVEANPPKELHFKVKKDSPITKSQNEYLKNLLKYHKIEDAGVFFDNPALSKIESLTKSQASRMIDRILSELGRPTV